MRNVLGAALATTALAGAAATGMMAGEAEAQTRLVLKSASSDSSYYVMTVQLGEMLRAGEAVQVQPTVEESQGSVQNVTEAGRRDHPFLFTTPPSLLQTAWADQKAGGLPLASGVDRLRGGDAGVFGRDRRVFGRCLGTVSLRLFLRRVVLRASLADCLECYDTDCDAGERRQPCLEL